MFGIRLGGSEHVVPRHNMQGVSTGVSRDADACGKLRRDRLKCMGGNKYDWERNKVEVRCASW